MVRKAKVAKKPTADEMLKEIVDGLTRIGNEIEAMPNGPHKIGLMERLVASYDKVIAMCKEVLAAAEAADDAAQASKARKGKRKASQDRTHSGSEHRGTT
jgi:DNA-binding ferritin-like protein